MINIKAVTKKARALFLLISLVSSTAVFAQTESYIQTLTGVIKPKDVCVAVDEKFVYWVTPTSILKQAKSGGKVEIVYQATDKEGVDELSQDAETLYFGFRGAGESRWDLRKISKTGGEPTTLAKRYSLKPVVVDDINVYFFNENGMSSELLCKISKNGGEATTLDSGYSSGVITQSKTQVYFASLDDIYSFQK